MTVMAPDTKALLDREVDDLLLDARGLALVRDLLRERGATSEEIDSHERALDRARTRLTEVLAGVSGSAGAVEAVERGHLRLAELEVEDPGVGDDPLPPARFRNHHRSALYRPAQQYLSGQAA
jgi:hypothetical protein